MVRKSFKEVMKDDVNNTFMNVDEFADMHTVDGKEIPVLVDDNEIIEREKKMKSNMDGVYVKQKLIYVKADDFGSLPAIGRQIVFDGKRYMVTDSTEDEVMGLQSGMIEFEVDQTQLQRIELKLKDMKAKAPQALKNAVNATARDAKKDLADKAKETYAVKSPRFKKAIAQKNATASNPTATLKITGAVNELADFKYKDNTSTDAARGKVLKASGLKSLQKGNLKAFITKFGSGHVSVVQRKGTSRLPLKKLLSPSIPTMVGNEAKVYGIVKPNIEKNLQKNIQKQIDKILGGK